MLKRALRAWVFWLGLVLLGLYWYSLHPIGWSRNGYAEDRCNNELSRQILSENLRRDGKLEFRSDSVMTPKGDGLPYMNWTYERDWVGAYLWTWNKDFPWFWVYYGLSLFFCYFATGAILRRMGLGPRAAWGIAALVTIFNLPRQVRTWRSYEQVQHWTYVGFFLDAWLWQVFVREKKWSLRIEAWRSLAGIAMLGGPGYVWPILFFEWLVVRACMAGAALATRAIKIEKPRARELALPALLLLPLLAIDLAWFLPLKAEADRAGSVYNNLAWFAHIRYFVRPLWLDPLLDLFRAAWPGVPALSSIETPETVVTIGWVYWIPFFAGLAALRRAGRGWLPVLPFLILIVVAVLYATTNFEPFLIQRLLMNTIPLMRFFRVASRWGLFLPPLVTIGAVLAWPELVARWRGRTTWLAVFAAFSLVEVGWVFAPKRLTPPLDANTHELLEEIRQAPGTTVLDLPFCVAGGNGMCTLAQCPNYPASTTGLCLRQIHEKKVYGLYSGRMMPRDCAIYDEPPYTSWFEAWGTQRCFTPPEWRDFCGYLDRHSELATILMYPDIWWGAGSPACQAEFETHLGKPLRQGQIPADAYYGGTPAGYTRVIRYAAKCRK